ncbi:hypothetical protein BDP67DRAFT_117523 [Colletotrichum lupini]|nr:hypothetical protein BDP67DRAFT_117523 [Colletotrichum lupini]
MLAGCGILSVSWGIGWCVFGLLQSCRFYLIGHCRITLLGRDTVRNFGTRGGSFFLEVRLVTVKMMSTSWVEGRSFIHSNNSIQFVYSTPSLHFETQS